MALVPVNEGHSEADRSNSSDSSSRALVLSLPEQWPLPYEPRRRFYNNLLFTTVTHTSVNKAQAHLELLQNAIEDWSVSKTPSNLSQSAALPRSATAKSMASSGEAAAAAAKKKKQQTAMMDALSTAQELEVIGIGQTQPSFHYYEDEPGVPYLGADDVIDEVVQLMVKLEHERLQAEEEIQRERHRVIDLAARIDMLTEAKLLRIPVAVQSEHEACIEDIAELNWHVQAKRKTLEKSRRMHAKSSRINEQMKEEMAYIKEHDPLVRQKLELELSKIAEIKETGTDTQKELQETQQHLEKAQKKNNSAHSTANQERARLQAEVDRATDNLGKATNAVQKSEEQYGELCSRIVDAKEQHKSNKQEIEVMQARNSAAEEKQKMLRATVDELQRQLRQEEHLSRNLDQELYETEDNHQKVKSNQEAQMSEMQAAVDHSEDKFIFLRREADEHTMELQDMQDKLKDCGEQKIDDEKNLVRMENELERTKEEMVKTLEQFSKVTKEHSSVSKKLESEEKKVMFVEDSLKASIANLQRQIQDEMNTRDNLIHRIETDTRELGNSRMESKVKKAKLKKMAEKMDLLVQQIRHKVEKLREESHQKAAAADEQQRKLDALLQERREVEERLDARISLLQPQHSQLDAEVNELLQKLADISQQIEQMNKKIKDIYDQSGMIKRTQLKFKDAIHLLENQLEQLRQEVGSTERRDDTLKEQVSAIESRIRSKADEHSRLQESRRETLRELNLQLQAAQADNKQFASDYRSRQNESLQMKEQLLDLMNEVLQHEQAVRDVKQGMRLQEKTHFALNYYLSCRQQLNELRMEDMQIRGRSNQHKTAILETEINKSLTSVTEFLQSQMPALMQGQRVSKQQQQQQTV